MDSLENVGTLLREYEDERNHLRCLEYSGLRRMNIPYEYFQRVYDCLFNWVADPTHSPESIIYLLDTYIRGLPGFSEDLLMQILVAFPCLEALARRRPAVLEGPWEKIAWIIIEYGTCSNTLLGINVLGKIKLNEGALKMIAELSTAELCPNPCLRLELFRLMRRYKHGDFDWNCVSLRDKVISTIFEVFNNYSSFTLEELPNFSPRDLQFIMNDSDISMKYIMNDCDLYSKRHDIIMAFSMLTRNLALLEKKRQLRLDSPTIGNYAWNAGLKNQLCSCLSFCGLLPYEFITCPQIKYLESKYIECWSYFVQAIGNDPMLMDNLIKTLNTVTDVSLCFPDEHRFHDFVTNGQNRVLHLFFKEHIRCLPKQLPLREIYGGLNFAAECRLRYLQNNTIGQYDDSEKILGIIKMTI